MKLVSSRKHEVLQNFLALLTLGTKKTQWTNTSKRPGTPNHHWLWKLWKIYFQSTCKIYFQQRTLEHSAAVQSFLSLAQARHFWCFFLFKTGLTPGMRQLKPMSCIYLHGGSWSSDSNYSPLFVTLPHIFEGFCSTIHCRVACTLFPTTFSPSLHLPINVLGHRALWRASLFSHDLLCLALLVHGVSGLLLDNCHVSSLPHDWYRTRLRDHLKAFAGVLSSLAD